MAEVLKCASCGGENKILEENFSVTCVFCGSVVEKPKPSTNLSKESEDQIANFLILAKNAMKSNNLTEAIIYYNKILEINPSVSDAWYGKAYCSGWSTNLANIKISEMLIGFKKALEYARADQKEIMKNNISSSINGCASAIYNLSYNHTLKFASVDNTYEEHLKRCVAVLNALEYAHSLNPESIDILKSLAKVSKDLLEPIKYQAYVNHQKRFMTHKLNNEYEKIITDFNVKYSSMLIKLDPNFQKNLESDLRNGKVLRVFGIVFLFFGALISLAGGAGIGFGLVLIICGVLLTLKGHKKVKYSKSILK